MSSCQVRQQSGRFSAAKLIVPLSNSGVDTTPYFLFSGAGGHVFPFQPFARLLGKRRMGLGLIDPAFFDDEPVLNSVEGYAARMIQDICAVHSRGPYLLAGYSFGGLVALEVARLLRAAQQDVALLLLDSILPGGLPKKPLYYRFWLRAKNTSAPAYPFSIVFPFLRMRYQRFDNFWKFRNKQRPAEISQRLKYIKQRARAARRRYTPKPCKVPGILIRATDVSPRFRPPHDYGWKDVVDLVSIVDIPAGHWEIYKGENLKLLALAAASSLDELERLLQHRSDAEARHNQKKGKHAETEK